MGCPKIQVRVHFAVKMTTCEINQWSHWTLSLAINFLVGLSTLNLNNMTFLAEKNHLAILAFADFHVFSRPYGALAEMFISTSIAIDAWSVQTPEVALRSPSQLTFGTCAYSRKNGQAELTWVAGGYIPWRLPLTANKGPFRNRRTRTAMLRLA